jgi:hypothetical protein
MKAFNFMDVKVLVGSERAEVLRRRVLKGERLKLCDVLFVSDYSQGTYREPADRYVKGKDEVKKE